MTLGQPARDNRRTAGVANNSNSSVAWEASYGCVALDSRPSSIA